MKTYFKIAWRNIWRNKRRTIITATSILFAILFALVMRAYQLGVYKSMTDSVVQSYLGHIQIHAKNYWKEKSLDYLMEYNEDLLNKIKSVKSVEKIIPHFESFALISAGMQTKVTFISGIDPDKENELSGLSKKVVHYRIDQSVIKKLQENGIPENVISKINDIRNKSFTDKADAEKKLQKNNKEISKYLDLILKYSEIKGSYISKDSKGINIGDRLARFLKVSIGDTLVLMGQGYQGVSAAGKFPVEGILRLPNPEIDNQMVYMNFQTCQELFTAENMLSALLINVKNSNELEKTKSELVSLLDTTKYEVMTWKEMNRELVQQIESDNYSGLIMLWILYIIVGFGVFGTVLMMTTERKKEFGVMVSLGFQKHKLVFVVLIELIMLTILGIIAGIALSLPIIRYYAVNPIELTGNMADAMEMFGIEPLLPFAWQFDYFVSQSGTVLLIIFLAVIFPVGKLLRLNVMKSLRG